MEGEVLVDGRSLGASFQRTTAYVAQMDVHDPTATVREALVFSALLRQPRDVPEAEKLAYVDTVMDMLEVCSFRLSKILYTAHSSSSLITAS